jgi:hypothetical protein
MLGLGEKALSAAVLERKATMKLDVGVRVDALLMGATGHLDMIVHYMKNNLSDDEYKNCMPYVGRAMGELVILSQKMHELFPDAIPDELK